MAYSSPITAVTGATFTAAQFNTSVRDNLNAIWVGTNAGDLDYYTSSSVKTRLAFTSGGVLYGSTSSAPAWLAAPGSVTSYLTKATSGIPVYASIGILSAIGYASFAPAQTSTSTSFADITNATTTLTLPVGNTYTVMALAGVVGSVNTGGFSCQVCAMIDGTIDPNQLSLTSATVNSPIAVGYRRTGIASGSRIVKLQFRVFGSGATATADRGWLLALAITE